LKLSGCAVPRLIVPVARAPLGLVMWIVSAFTPALAKSYQLKYSLVEASLVPPIPTSAVLGLFAPLLTKVTVAFLTPLSLGVKMY
jgi:hypothetical protein